MYDTKKDDFRVMTAFAKDDYQARDSLERIMDNVAAPYGDTSSSSVTADRLKSYLRDVAEYAGWHY